MLLAAVGGCAGARSVNPGAEPPEPPRRRVTAAGGCAGARSVNPGAEPPEPPRRRVTAAFGAAITLVD
jgi:hypothetical protein